MLMLEQLKPCDCKVGDLKNLNRMLVISVKQKGERLD